MYLFVICLIVRSLLAYYAMEYSYEREETFSKIILYFTTIAGLSFWALFLFNLRQTAEESSAKDNKVWWSSWRPVHGTLYLLFAYSYYNEYTQAYLILFVDVAIGYFLWTDRQAGKTR